jgi:quinol monooxygenase YgiN
MTESGGAILAVTWIARPGHEDQVKEILVRLADESRREPGCRQYIVHQAKSDPAHFFLYEEYSSAEALREHSESRHFKRYVLDEAIPHLVSRQRVELTLLTT